MVRHGHILVNGRKVDIGSYLVKVGDEVSLKSHMHQNAMVLENRNLQQGHASVPWLEMDRENYKARVVAFPKREDVTTPPITEQMIVELYSK